MGKFFGPSTLIAAAFIGPGTLTTCTIVGVQTGYGLLWVLVFAIAATIILQEMAARLGFVTRAGLGEAFNRQFTSSLTRYFVFFLVISAILIGNAAYEAGNLAGGVLGLNLMAGEFKTAPLLIGGLCFGLLFWGGYKGLEKVLIGMVLLMSICFLITALLVKPDLVALLKGFIPSHLSGANFLLVMGLIGTTVVPYNLFLHASTISKKWSKEASLKAIRLENRVAILLGGLISILIIITAAALSGVVEEVTSAKDLALQLEPLFGRSAQWFMGLGLLAAGVSSALTAPLAAAYAAKGLFNWSDDEKQLKFRAVWMVILIIGILVSITDVERVLIIKFAQITNALLLPLIAIYLLYISNSSKILGRFTNSKWANVLAVLVILITILLGVKTLSGIF